MKRQYNALKTTFHNKDYSKMKKVIIETPYAGDVKKNTQYARKCMLDSLMRNEAPFLSHLLYTQILDDNDTLQRALGIEAGLIWGKEAEMTVVYTDLGISKGMQYGIDRAIEEGRTVEYRTL